MAICSTMRGFHYGWQMFSTIFRCVCHDCQCVRVQNAIINSILNESPSYQCVRTLLIFICPFSQMTKETKKQQQSLWCTHWCSLSFLSIVCYWPCCNVISFHFISFLNRSYGMKSIHRWTCALELNLMAKTIVNYLHFDIALNFIRFSSCQIISLLSCTLCSLDCFIGFFLGSSFIFHLKLKSFMPISFLCMRDEMVYSKKVPLLNVTDRHSTHTNTKNANKIIYSILIRYDWNLLMYNWHSS